MGITAELAGMLDTGQLTGKNRTVAQLIAVTIHSPSRARLPMLISIDLSVLVCGFEEKLSSADVDGGS